MNNISYLRACNALYNNLSTQTKIQVGKNLLVLSDVDKNNTTGYRIRQNTTSQQKSLTFLKNGYFYHPGLHSGKMKMNPRYGNVFIINRTLHSRHSNLSSPSKKDPNLYDVLGLSPNAKAAEIKSSFYKLSKTFHPDINKSEEAATRFAEILSAYEILGNQTKRRMYDRGVMTHPRFGGASSHPATEPRKKRPPMKPGGVGQRPEGAGHYRDFTDASGRPAFKFDTDFQDYYSTSRENRIFTEKESEFFMKRHHEDEQSRKIRGVFAGIFVFTFLGLAFLSKQIKYRQRNIEGQTTSTSSLSDKK